MGMDEIWELERGFWFGGADAYEQQLGPEALMVFPAPVGMVERSAVIEVPESRAIDHTPSS